jgi:putative transferase (TIGR04331 family)
MSGDEELKFYAARSVENGSRLVAVQHGGGYGVYRSAPAELHEHRLADHFLAWGWADKGSRNSANVVNPKFPKLESQLRHRRMGATVVFIATGTERYLYRVHSCPVGTQWDGYYDWQSQFLTRLGNELRSFVVFRSYPANYGHRGELYIRRLFPALTRDDSPKLIHERFAAARVVVIDHLGTSLLEALAANIPTILFWDANRWEARHEAEPYFDRLRQAEILWHSPDGAAEKLTRVYEDPRIWWDADNVQTARLQFINQHALTERNWTRSWIDSLRRLV